MARPKPWEVDDELWSLIEPLLPTVERRRTHPARKRTGRPPSAAGPPVRAIHRIQWEFLPQELGFGSGMTCWHRLGDWNMHGAGQLDFSRTAIAASHLRALREGAPPSLVRRRVPLEYWRACVHVLRGASCARS